MITFDFLKKVHRLVEKFPERLEEFKILYPEAFKKVDITDDIKVKLYGGTWKTFHFYDGEERIAEMKPFVQTLQVFNSRKDDPEEKKMRLINFPAVTGYKVEFNSNQNSGFRIYRYGEKRDIIDLEFDSAAEKNRIKEKS